MLRALSRYLGLVVKLRSILSHTVPELRSRLNTIPMGDFWCFELSLVAPFDSCENQNIPTARFS